jgi:hypothetical protein
MVQLTYYVAPWDREQNAAAADASKPGHARPQGFSATGGTAADVPIRGEYSLRSLERLSLLCVRECWAGRGLSFGDRQAAAWDAMAEFLLLSEDIPLTHQMVRCGMEAILRYVHEEYRHHGWDHVEQTTRPAFERWWNISRTIPQFADRVIDETALRQIWAVLPDRHRETLLVYAAAGSAPAAAEAAGKKYGTFTKHLSEARRAFLDLWHEGEEPAGLWCRDNHLRGSWNVMTLHRNRQRNRARRVASPRPPKPPRTHCGNGHDLAEVGVTGPRDTCKACSRESSRRHRAKKLKEGAA